MKQFLLGAAAALAISAPGAAAAQSAGYIGATYGNAEVNTPLGDADGDFYGIEGAAAFGESGSVIFEVDAAVTDGDETDTAYGVMGHLYGRNDDHLFGGFVGFAGNDDSDTWTAGLEANKYFSSWTLGGALAYVNDDDTDVDGWGANAEGRYFLGDNFRLDGNLGYVNFDAGGSDVDAMMFGVGGEYQFATMPISLTAGYDRLEFNDADVDLGVWSLGVRYNFGGTLRDRDRSGASQANILGLFSSGASAL
jgi:hypothetical protein